MKACTKCKKVKKLIHFSKNKGMKDGLRHECKACDHIRWDKRKKSKIGLCRSLYNNQRGNSRERGHKMPSYNGKELETWLFEQPNFNLLYEKWKASNYQHLLIPSCDRLNDYKPYSLDNLQLMTWGENKLKGERDRINGINRKNCVPVLQIDRYTDKVINEYYSIGNAHRKTGVHRSHITECCKGLLKTTGGFKWKYAKKN